MLLRPALVSLSLLVALPAHASGELDLADEAFARGAFLEAAQQARRAGTAEANAFAARAELAQGEFLASGEDRRELVEQGIKDARAAVALDPRNPEGHLYLALGLGFLGRLDGSLAAHFAGYAEEAREHIDKALELAPTNPWANALLGGWNLEIVHDGGMLGEELYGASLERGLSAYTYALALDSGNAAIAYQYALQLIALGGPSRRIEAGQALTGALRAAPQDAFERLAYQRAERLKLALDMHDEKEVQGILRAELGLNATPAAKDGDVATIGSPR
jgi:hypothetical protein